MKLKHLSKLDNSTEDLTISSVPNALIRLNSVIDLGLGAFVNKCHVDRIIHTEMETSFKEKMKAVGNRCDLILNKDQGHAFFAKKPINYFIEITHEIDKFLVSLRYLRWGIQQLIINIINQ